jgi:hypothetical protein
VDILLGALAILAWFVLAALLYFFVVRVVYKDIENMTPRQRIEMFETRRQRYLKMSKNKKLK